MTDIRKPFLKSFTVNELIQFIDYYMEHGEMLHVPGHLWEECDLVARFLGFGYSRQWTPDETAVLVENYTLLGAEKTSGLLPMRTAFDCKLKADNLGLRTNIKPSRKRGGSAWTIHEIDILSKYYPLLGLKTMVLLPGRTDTSCAGMAQKLGICGQIAEPWSERELEVLKNNYPEMGKGASILLPGRSEYAIRDRARKHGIPAPAKAWTAEEDEIIKAHYPQMGASVASLFQGRRTESACLTRAYVLGVRASIKEAKWSEGELKILKENYPSMGGNVQELLPGRTETACRTMAKKLELTRTHRKPSMGKRWTDEELEILKEIYPEAGTAGVQKLLPHRSVAACETMANKIGVSTRPAKWSAGEIEILKNNYHKLGKNVAELLPGRTVVSCQVRAAIMGFSIEGHYWSAEEDEILRTYYPREGKAVSQRLPHRSESACTTRANSLGIKVIKSTDDYAPQTGEPDGSGQLSAEAGTEVDASCQMSTASEAPQMADIGVQAVEESDEPQPEESNIPQFGMMQM